MKRRDLCEVILFEVILFEVMWSVVMWSELTWFMWSDFIWSDVEWTDVIYVKWFYLKWCEVQWCGVLWRHLCEVILFWSEVSYDEVLGDKSTMYIRVTLCWGYLIVLWLFHLGISGVVFVLICTVVVLYYFVKCVCMCVWVL